MKTLAHFLLLLALCSLSGCLFKQPVFTEGFARIGVWAADGKNGDPRQTEFAVCAPLDGDRYLLQHPAGPSGGLLNAGGLLYEARLLHVRGRSLLQLRLLASFTDGLAKAGAERCAGVDRKRGRAKAPHPRARQRGQWKGCRRPAPAPRRSGEAIEQTLRRGDDLPPAYRRRPSRTCSEVGRLLKKFVRNKCETLFR